MSKGHFKMNTDLIHIAATTEDSISKTIEELLDLNEGIPKRWDKEPMSITEVQLEDTDYMNKPSRGEENEVTEGQFGDRDSQDPAILEVKLETASGENNGHRPEMWDMNDIEVRGHKAVAPIWHEVYKNEDEREKMDKGQLHNFKK